MKLFLEAGETRSLTEEGYSCYVVSSDGPVSVRLAEYDGELIEAEQLSAGQGLKAKNRFERYSIKNNHTVAQWVTLYTGAAEFVDNRNVGVVQVSGVVGVDVQREGSTVYAGIAGSAGKYSSAALINPHGSGVKLLLERVRWSISSNSIARLSINADTPSGWTDFSTTPIQQGSEIIKRGNHSGAVIAEYDVMGAYIAGHRVLEFSPPSPIVLLEGDSAWARVDLVGATFYPEFSWVEESL